jgi:hypothetical protein
VHPRNYSMLARRVSLSIDRTIGAVPLVSAGWRQAVGVRRWPEDLHLVSGESATRRGVATDSGHQPLAPAQTHSVQRPGKSEAWPIYVDSLQEPEGSGWRLGRESR